MKRSEFGFNEWCEFMPEANHKFSKLNCICVLDYRGVSYDSGTWLCIDSAARNSVEALCHSTDIPLPWEPDKPDFSTWSRDECEEYFKEQKCNWHTYNNTSGRLMGGTYSAIMLDDKFYSHFGDAINGPSLKNYQDAAEYVWEKVNKQEE